MKAVFDVSPASRYRDEIWHRYDIPNRPQAELVRHCVNDWVVFRRTAKSSRSVYFAVARVESVEPDPERPSFFFARIRDFLAFPSAVPFRIEGHYAESDVSFILRPAQIGQHFQGNPIRQLWPTDFDRIVRKGFARVPEAADADDETALASAGFEEQSIERWIDEPTLRRVDLVLRHLPFREASFRLNVGRAYSHTCAFTGVGIASSRNRHEVHAAHLWFVSEGGPDVVQNGICANRTVHWALDEHLLTIDENHRPIVARNPELVGYLRSFPDFGAFVTLPRNASDYPNPVFLARHRAAFWAKNSARGAADLSMK